MENPDMQCLLEKAAEISGERRGTLKLITLCGDGSDRRFFRIRGEKSSFVALISPRKKEGIDENDSYLRIGKHLYARQVCVPRILYSDAEAGRFLLEDAGDLHLQRFVQSHRWNMPAIYIRVIGMLAGLHRKAADGFSPTFCFDTSIYDAPFIYERELEYFRKAFLNGYLGLELAGEDLLPDFENIAEAAGVSSGQYVFHRDFQSRNIMVRENRLWLIDFQGMRFGPPEYDLASLLVDPYVSIPPGTQRELADAYWVASRKFLKCTRGEFLRRYNAVRLCRNLQILGAFGFLGVVKGKKTFLQYIPGAWKELVRHLRENNAHRYPRLQKIVDAVQKAGIVARRLDELR